ncbi:MAG: hypothetical protein HUU57_13225 [Bdellovibrio sp.]|nr:hypothetical protein [Bdellovibrio sp.]
MSLQLYILAFLGLGFTPLAFASEKLETCSAKNYAHVVVLKKVGSDLHASLENKSLTKYGKIGNSSEGRYEVAGKERSLAVVKNIDLESFRASKSVAKELMLLLLSGRQDAVDEEDMLGANASALVASLSCE